MEAAIEAQRAEVKDYREKLLKQAEMRREFLQSNAQLIDMKKIEKELNEIELLQVIIIYHADKSYLFCIVVSFTFFFSFFFTDTSAR